MPLEIKRDFTKVAIHTMNRPKTNGVPSKPYSAVIKAVLSKCWNSSVNTATYFVVKPQARYLSSLRLHFFI